jgi:hypothetical protein
MCILFTPPAVYMVKKGGDANVWPRIFQFFIMVDMPDLDDSHVFFHDEGSKGLYDVRVWLTRQRQISHRRFRIGAGHTR